jgi:MYXO-CTERM domain-containing protein
MLGCDAEPGDPNTGEDCEEGLDDDCDGVVDEADDCGGRADAGLVITGTDAIDNCNCDAGGRGSAPWWLAVLLFGGWRRRRPRAAQAATADHVGDAGQ